MVIYRHTQAGTLVRWLVGGMAVYVATSMLPDPALLIAAIPVLAILLVCLLLFHSLSTTVSTDRVIVAFGPGWIRRSIPLRSIVAAKIVQNPWWYGWGIRLTPAGWLWNVSGLQAVELELTDGTRFRLGTDEPRRLQTAIDQAGRLDQRPTT
jgi:hypothetical protein